MSCSRAGPAAGRSTERLVAASAPRGSLIHRGLPRAHRTSRRHPPSSPQSQPGSASSGGRHYAARLPRPRCGPAAGRGLRGCQGQAEDHHPQVRRGREEPESSLGAICAIALLQHACRRSDEATAPARSRRRTPWPVPRPPLPPTAAAAACSAAACRLLRRRKAEKCDVKAENGDSVEVHYLVRAPAISVGVNRWGQLNEPGSRGRSRGAVTRACCRLPWRPNPRAPPNLRPPSHPPIHPPTTFAALPTLAGHADRRQEV